MQNNDSSDLQKVPVRTSLNRHITLFGGERTLVLLAVLLSVYFLFLFTLSYGVMIGLIIGGVFWFVMITILTRMGKADMQLSAVYRRQMKYRKFYPALGRIDSDPVRVDGFTRLR